MLASEIKTASDLRAFVEAAGLAPHFFNRKTMMAFGDTMKNYGVCKTTVNLGGDCEVEAWELYRKRPVKGGLQSSAYFCPTTFRRIHPHK